MKLTMKDQWKNLVSENIHGIQLDLQPWIEVEHRLLAVRDDLGLILRLIHEARSVHQRESRRRRHHPECHIQHQIKRLASTMSNTEMLLS